MIKCMKCGAELPETANFCNVCGNTVEKKGSTDTPVNLRKNLEEPRIDSDSPQSDQVSPFDGNQQAGNNQQFNNGQQTGNGQQFNNNQQAGNGQQYNNNQQFNNGQQFNNNQQAGYGQQAPPKETASSYYGKQPYVPAADDIQANKGIAICAYLGILWIIPLITVKNSPFTKFHTNQAILVFGTSFILNVAVRIFNMFILAIFWRFYVITGFLSFIAAAFGIALMVVGIVYAAQGKMKEIPILGQIHILK